MHAFIKFHILCIATLICEVFFSSIQVTFEGSTVEVIALYWSSFDVPLTLEVYSSLYHGPQWMLRTTNFYMSIFCQLISNQIILILQLCRSTGEHNCFPEDCRILWCRFCRVWCPIVKGFDSCHLSWLPCLYIHEAQKWLKRNGDARATCERANTGTTSSLEGN